LTERQNPEIIKLLQMKFRGLEGKMSLSHHYIFSFWTDRQLGYQQGPAVSITLQIEKSRGECSEGRGDLWSG